MGFQNKKYLTILFVLIIVFISLNLLAADIVINPKGYYDSISGNIITGKYIYIKDGIIEKIENNKEHFIDFHSFRTRKAGSERHIDFHLTVCKYHTIEHAHDLADKIEGDIETLFNETHILIHHEPCNEVCEGCTKACKV